MFPVSPNHVLLNYWLIKVSRMQIGLFGICVIMLTKQDKSDKSVHFIGQTSNQDRQKVKGFWAIFK
jgi:hypothetical protein